jgi:hypothetical protein
VGSQAAEDRDRIVEVLAARGENDGWTPGSVLIAWCRSWPLRLGKDQAYNDVAVLVGSGRIERRRTTPEGTYPPRYEYRVVREAQP